MRECEEDSMSVSGTFQSLLQVIRAAGAVLGVAVIAIGLMYAARVFTAIFTVLQAPEKFQVHLDKWAMAVGGEGLDLVIAGTTYPCASIIAIAVLGGGAIVLAWISMGLVLAGAKTVSWTLSDREAVKKLLIHAFGPAKRPEKNKPSGGVSLHNRQ